MRIVTAELLPQSLGSYDIDVCLDCPVDLVCGSDVWPDLYQYMDPVMALEKRQNYTTVAPVF